MVEGEVLREEGDEFSFDAVGDVVEMIAVVDLELMRDGIAGEDRVEVPGGEGDAVILVSGIEPDGFVATEVDDVLVDHVQRFVGVIFSNDLIDELAVFCWKIQVKGRSFRIGSPGRRKRKEKAGQELERLDVLKRFGSFGLGTVCSEQRSRKSHATSAEEIEAREGFRMAHGDAHGAIAAHGVAREATAGPCGNRPIVRVNIRDKLVDDVPFPIASGDGIGIEAALVTGERVGRHKDNFAIAGFRERFVDDRGEIDPMLDGTVPLVVAVGVAMEEVDDGVATMRTFGVAGREIDGNGAVWRIALEIAFERFAADGDVFDAADRAAWNGGGGLWRGGRFLRKRGNGCEEQERENVRNQFDRFHGKGW